jgi:sulfatase modifying factor 1
MKNNRTILSLGLAVLAGVSLVTPALAVNIAYVPVGNAGNTADTADGDINTPGVQRFGAVGYAYQIAKNETTISQYADFLNAVAKTDTYGLYSTSMTQSYINGISRAGVSGSYVYSEALGTGNKPITYVSWFDAARFCNWMHNGQPTGLQTVGTTEGGAYPLNGAVSGIITKNVAAKVWIPSEDEWYR